MAGKPATLEGSLLARKGAAAPVIPDGSPMTDSIEAATSDVVPLHRVAVPAPEPEHAAPAPSVILPEQRVSPRRRAVIILVALLVLCLIAVALAARGDKRGGQPAAPPAAETGAVTAPAPDPVLARPNDPPVAPPELVAEVTPPEPRSPPAAPPPAAAAPLEKPKTVTPRLLATAPSKRYVLQFASLGGKRRAFEEAARLQKRIGGILGGRKIVVVNSRVNGRARYRLRAGAFGSLRAAIATCQRVARFAVECLPIRR